MSIKILQYNVNKSRNKVLAALLADQRVKTYDILAVQEPWRNPYDSAAYNPRDSGFYIVDRKESGSRVSTYINKRIATTEWNEVRCTPDLHTISIRLDGVQTYIHNVYCPPPASHTDTSIPAIFVELENALVARGDHIVLGDLNLHHPLWCGPTYPHQHKIAEQLINIMQNACVSPTLPPGTITREAMRGANMERTTIDQIWMSQALQARLIHCKVDRDLEQASDHLPISTHIQLGDACETQGIRARRAWKSMDIEKFGKVYQRETAELASRPLDSIEETEGAISTLYTAIEKAVDSSTPWSRICEYSKPWWTPECERAVRETRTLRNRFTRSQTEEAWREYLRAKNRKGKVINKAKRDHHRETMRSAGETHDTIWRFAKWARTRVEGKPTQTTFPTLTQNAYEAQETSSKAALLKTVHFPPPVEADLDDLRGYIYPQEAEMPSQLTEMEVTSAILATARDKAPGPDDIPNRVLHRIVAVSPATLVRLFQACLDHGIQPRKWKEAIIIFLRKPNKPDYSDPKAYRPIALLNTLGKALEAVVARRVRFLAEKHTLLPGTQMGARQGRSVETALQLLLEKIYTIWASNKPRVATLLSLDVASAFDRVSHARLIHNLRKKRIPRTLTRWIQNFLEDRTVEIRIAGYTHPKSTVHTGIPQGSPISPILYLFYNSDLLESLESIGLQTSAIGFMDDVNILTFGKTTEGNCRTLQHTHDACETWARRHGSKFNPQKYELIHFTRKPKRYNMDASMEIDGQTIQPTGDVRILGVQLDSALRWKPHLRTLEAKAERTLNALKTTTGSTWGMSMEASRKLYAAVARPTITFGAGAWYTPDGIKGHRKTTALKLKAIQGRFLKTVTGAYRATSTEALEIETYTQPLDIYLDGLVAKSTLNASVSQAYTTLETARVKIRQQMRSNRGRQARTRPTEGIRKQQWLQSLGIQTPGPQPSTTPPPWGDNREHTRNTDDTQARSIEDHKKRIVAIGKERWKTRWQLGEKGQHLRDLVAYPTRATRTLHAGRTKPKSAILTQLRTGKIGFNDFLFERRVPGVTSRRCACEQGAMTVRHILLICPRWRQERQELGIDRKDLRYLLTTREGATTAINFLLRTDLLEQFRGYAGGTHATRQERVEGEEEGGEEEEEEGEREEEEG
jgi:exonuclease III